MTVGSKADGLNSAVDTLITTFATQHNLTLQEAVTAILESPTVTSILATQSHSVGLVKQYSPAKLRQRANFKAADDAVADMTLENFSITLITWMRTFIRSSFSEAAEMNKMVGWLSELPANDKALEVGLEYTDAMVKTIFFRLQDKFKELVGSVIEDFEPEYESRLAETREEIEKSVQKRLKTVDPAAVEKEVNTMMADFKKRFSVKPNTEWIVALHAKKMHVDVCMDFLAAMFIYSVDLKWCDCGNRDEYEEKFKAQRKKPAKPDNPRVHGHNRAPWAVTNWANRIKGNSSSLMMHEQSLLSRTLQLMQPFTDMLDRALDCLPAVGMRAVFRGVPVRLSDQFEINDEFTMEPHTSTSLEGEEALTFMDPKKPGTFFVLRLHSPAMIDFMSAYPHQAEALLAMHATFRVATKLSRTVLRMLGCRFDVIMLVESGSNATDTEQIEFLIRTARQTQFICRDYLKSMVPVRVYGEARETTTLLSDRITQLVEKKSKTSIHHVLITGDAGCGKTSATLAAHSILVQQNGCYAVLVPLPSVKKFGSNSDIDNTLLEQLDISAACFTTLCKHQKVFVILDSLDEVGQISKETVNKGVLPRNKLLQLATVVMSCRSELLSALDVKDHESLFHGVKEKKDGSSGDDDDGPQDVIHVDTWTIAPFSDADSRELVKRRAMKDDSVTEAQLTEHVNLAPQELRRHPLVMQMILRIPVGMLPQGSACSRNDIYRCFIETLINEAFSNEDERDAVLSRLQELALNEMLLEEQWHVTVGTAKRILECTGEHLELLPFRVDDPNENESQIGFLHRTQAEYLAAMALTKEPSTIKSRTNHIPATAKRGTLGFILEGNDAAAQEATISELIISCGEGASLIDTLMNILKEKEDAHGVDSEEVTTTLMMLGNAYADTDKKIHYLERTLDLQQKLYGPDDVKLASTLNNLGSAYGDKGDFDKQIEYSERSVALMEKEFGPDHHSLAPNLMNLGNAYAYQGNTEKEIEYSERALQLQINQHGDDHIGCALILANLGLAYGSDGNYYRQLEYEERALALQERHYGPDHIELAFTLGNLGFAHSELQSHAKAVHFMTRSIDMKEKYFGADHPELINPVLSLSSFHRDLGENEKALELVERGLRHCTEHYGRNHPSTMKNLRVYKAVQLAQDASRQDLVEKYEKWLAEET